MFKMDGIIWYNDMNLEICIISFFVSCSMQCVQNIVGSILIGIAFFGGIFVNNVAIKTKNILLQIINICFELCSIFREK